MVMVLFLMFLTPSSYASHLPSCDVFKHHDEIRAFPNNESGSEGAIRFDSAYSPNGKDEKTNTCGQYRVYLVHQDGSKKWFNEANQKYKNKAEIKAYGCQALER